MKSLLDGVRHGSALAQIRWTLWWARRRLDMARYWHTRADLDEAARHAHHALRLGAGAGSAALTVHAVAALTVAAIDRDRALYPASHAHLIYVISVLDAAPRTAERERLLARALTDLGDCHRRAGRYPQATSALRRARGLIENGDPPDPALMRAVLTMRGIIAKELGAYDEAAQCYAEVTSTHSRRAATLAEQATMQHNLAGLAYAQQQFPQAESHARRAVQLRHQAKAAAVELAADLAVLGAAIAAQHRHDEARDHLSRALATCRTARPPRHYEIAVQLHNLAAVDQADGRSDDAERRYRQALDIKEHLLGAEHPEVGSVCNNLGTLLHEQCRSDEAAQCYRRALSIAERTHPAGHPVVAAIRDNLHRLTSSA